MKFNVFNKNKIKKNMSENITQTEYSHGLFLDYTFLSY